MTTAFQYLNQYYDKIFVLSLPRLHDRIAHINTALQGLNYEFFWGVDKENTSIEQLKTDALYNSSQYQEFYKKPEEMALGMLCCSLGHLQIYEYIVKNKIERTLILEDDAIPDIQALNAFPDIIKELPADWELFYLGYEKNEKHGRKEKIKKKYYQLFNSHAQLKMNRDMFKKFYPEKISNHIAHAGFHDCTHAYSISLNGAEKLNRYQKPVRFNPDNLLSYLVLTNKIKGYISIPKLFSQQSAFSNLNLSLTS